MKLKYINKNNLINYKIDKIKKRKKRIKIIILLIGIIFFIIILFYYIYSLKYTKMLFYNIQVNFLNNKINDNVKCILNNYLINLKNILNNLKISNNNNLSLSQTININKILKITAKIINENIIDKKDGIIIDNK